MTESVDFGPAGLQLSAHGLDPLSFKPSSELLGYYQSSVRGLVELLFVLTSTNPILREISCDLVDRFYQLTNESVGA